MITCSRATSYTLTLDSSSGAALAGGPLLIPGICARANQIVPISNRIAVRPGAAGENYPGIIVLTVNY